MSECVQCGQKLIDGHALNGVCDKCRGQSELPSSTGSDAEVLGRIMVLQKECGELVDLLVFQGQHVAAAGMYDAVCGLQKTISVWNHGIKWQRQNCDSATSGSYNSKPK